MEILRTETERQICTFARRDRGGSAFGFTAALLTVLALLPACTQKPASRNVLARVGEREITIQDFEREVQWYQKSRRPVPEKHLLLEAMIAHELRLQKARASGLENDPEVRRRYEAILAGKLEEVELKPRLEQLGPSQDETRAVYQQELAKYSQPAKLRLSLIVVKSGPKSTAEQVSEAENRIAEARRAALASAAEKKGLGAAAADYSDDQASRYRGGDVGWFDEGRTQYRWPNEVVAAGFALARNGDLSEVIRTADGFYLVTRTDYRPATITPFEQVQSSIQRRVLAEKRQQAEASFNQQLRAFARVQTFSELLAQVPYPGATQGPGVEPRPPGLHGMAWSSTGHSPTN